MKLTKKVGVMILVLTLFILIISSIAYAVEQAPLFTIITEQEAQRGNYCAEDRTLFKFSNVAGRMSNSHGEAFGQPNNYRNYVCYGGPLPNTIDRTCKEDNSNLILKLSGQTNAHAETKNVNNPEYSTKVCYTGITCETRQGSCNQDEACIVKLSGETNAHLTSCNENDPAYPVALCCRSGTEPLPSVYLGSDFEIKVGQTLPYNGEGTAVGFPRRAKLSYEWDFDGDGNIDSTRKSGAWKGYTQPGDYTMSLVVKGKGKLAYDIINVKVTGEAQAGTQPQTPAARSEQTGDGQASQPRQSFYEREVKPKCPGLKGFELFKCMLYGRE